MRRRSMQQSLTYRRNPDLFKPHYLDNLLPETDEWEDISEDEAKTAFQEIKEIYDIKEPDKKDYDEQPLEDEVLRPVFDVLGHHYGVQQQVRNVRRFPDYGFFSTDEAKENAYERVGSGYEDFYREAIAVGDAKRWRRPLDKGGEESMENPSHQISVYLLQTPVDWAILTNGAKWRLYFSGTSRKLDSYYEIDLPKILSMEDEEARLNAFRYFYAFFRREAFIRDAQGESFLDRVYNGSIAFSRELGEDLQGNVYDAIRVLAEGFLSYNDDLDADEDLSLIHDASLVYLYRLIFVLYAESEGRDLLNTYNRLYRDNYSLNETKKEVARKLAATTTHYTNFRTELWDDLAELFQLIDRGSEAMGIDRDQLYVPAYNGGLFRTDSDAHTTTEVDFIQTYSVPDSYLAKVIYLLTRREAENGGDDIGESGMIFVDYSSLNIRHLGSIYEGLLKYELNVAPEDLVAVREGDTEKWVSKSDFDGDPSNRDTVEKGDVYLTTDMDERKTTGSYYTPEYVVQYMVENTLEPLVSEIREELVAQDQWGKGDTNVAEKFAERIFNLKVLDPAVGSGHFLVDVVDYLAHEIIEAREKQAEEAGRDTLDESHDIHWARRQVAQKCIYGVDVNSMATELAKVSLWLRTLAAEQPLAFLDHHLKTGNSLLGSDIEEISELREVGVANDENSDDEGPGRQSTLFAEKRKAAMEHLSDLYQQFIAIENRDRADAKEMETKHREIERDRRRQQLVEIANVHTAEHFGVDVPDDGYEQMAEAANGASSWEPIEEKSWFETAQEIAANHQFFHWQLEFPEVFYNEEGDGLSNPGFNVVLGNPPYLNAWRMTEEMPEFRDVIKSKYSDTGVLEGHWDLYVPFVALSLELTKEDGRHSFILPNPILTEKYATSLRKELLSNHAIESILSFDEINVFEEVDRQTIVYVVKAGSETPKTESLRVVKQPTPLEYDIVAEIDHATWLDVYNYQIRIDENFLDYLPIMKEIEENFDQIGNHFYVNYGAQVSSKEKGKFSKKDVVFDQKEPGAKKFFEGGDVSRYLCEWSGKYLDYREDEMYGARDPALFESDKIVVSVRTAGQERLSVAFEDGGMYCDHTVIICCYYDDIEGSSLQSEFDDFDKKDQNPDQYFVLAQLNSSLLTWMFKNKFATGALQGSFSDVWPESVRSLPLKTVDNVEESNMKAKNEALQESYNEYVEGNLGIDEVISHFEEVTDENEGAGAKFLGHLASEMESSRRKRNNVQLDLLEDLGSDLHGEQIVDIGIYQPASGVKDSVLDDTTDEKSKLSITNISTKRISPTQVRVFASLRYKPEDPDDVETDDNNYTYTDNIHAFDIMELSKFKADLVEEFLPAVAVKAGGYADFRSNATKTIAPLERIKSIILPEFDDVQDDVDRYFERKRYVAELDEELAMTDALIDKAMYKMYDLTDEQMEIVEDAMAGSSS